jgi:hypothetical protein
MRPLCFKGFAIFILALFLCVKSPGQSSGTISVSATANPWRAGGFVLPEDPGGFGIGDVPPEITFPAGSSKKINISASGSWSCGLGTAGPSGGSCGAFPNVNVLGSGGISGILIQQMTLVGVFLNQNSPPNVIAGNGIGNVFPIGNGGDFDVPPTATRLILGMPDECTGGGGGSTASCYGDNFGSVSVTYNLGRQYHISLSAFIKPSVVPAFPGEAGPGVCFLLSPRTKLRYSGDDRDFDPSLTTNSFRVHDEITIDQAGSIVSNEQPATGISRSWAPDAFDSNGTFTSEALADTVLDDCHLLHGQKQATTDGMTINVIPVSANVLNVRLLGKVGNPLLPGSTFWAPIQWDLTLTIDSSSNPAQISFTGFHTCYPAVELYVKELGIDPIRSLIQWTPDGNDRDTITDCLTLPITHVIY